MTDVHDFWSGAGVRQAKKLEAVVERICGREQLKPSDVVDRVMAWGIERSGDRPPPVYVSGLGGSGSHWLAGMLGNLDGITDAGEVYFSDALTQRMEDLPATDRGFVVDCIHLLHAWARNRPVQEARVVNSAAGAYRIPLYKKWDREAFGIHLHRDPGNQCMSVAFRKREYREFVAPGVSDEDYLIDRARRNAYHWFRYRDLGRPADFECRYETLKAHTYAVMQELLRALKHPYSSQQLKEVVRRHDADAIRAGLSTVRGNLDEGGVSKDWRVSATVRQRQILHGELARVFYELGYDLGACFGEVVDSAPPQPAFIDFGNPSWGQLSIRSEHGRSWEKVGRATGTMHLPPRVAVRLYLDPVTHPGQLTELAPEALSAMCVAGHPAVSDETVSVFRRFRGLQELDLARTGMTDAAVPELARLQALRGLSLYGTDISEHGLTALRQELPDCQIVTT